MTDDQWYGLALGVLGVVGVVAGICAHQLGNLINAMADRIRYGKQEPPKARSGPLGPVP